MLAVLLLASCPRGQQNSVQHSGNLRAFVLGPQLLLAPPGLMPNVCIWQTVLNIENRHQQQWQQWQLAHGTKWKSQSQAWKSAMHLCNFHIYIHIRIRIQSCSLTLAWHSKATQMPGQGTQSSAQCTRTHSSCFCFCSCPCLSLPFPPFPS